MQVAVSVPADGLGLRQLDASGLQAMWRVFWGFSIIVMLLSSAILILLVLISFVGVAWQLMWGFMHRGKPVVVGALQA